MVSVAEFHGWAGNIGFIAGTWFMYKRRPVLSLFGNFVGNLFYVLQSIACHNSPLLYLSIFLGVMNILSVRVWTRPSS